MLKKVFLIAAILILCQASFAAQSRGYNYHEVQVMDELGRKDTSISSVEIYLEGTTTKPKIYADRGLSNAIALPMTSVSANTTLLNGKFSWWGPDGYDYTITDGTRILNNSYGPSLDSSVGTIVMPTWLQAVSTTTYGDTESITMGTSADWVINAGTTDDLITFTPHTNGAVFRVGTADGLKCADLQWYTASGVGLMISESGNTLGITGLTTSINTSSNYATNINTGTSTGTVTIGGTGVMAIDIGTGGTGAKTITIGDAASTGAITIQSGTGDLTLTSTDDVTINGGSSGSLINIGTNTHGNVFHIGDNDSNADTITIGSAKDTTAIAGISLTLGSTGTTSTTAIRSGSGGVNINVTNNHPTNINTGTSTGAVTIGSSTSGAFAVDSTSTVAINADESVEITTTDASGDIKIDATAGSVIIDGGEAAADAVVIRATGTAGGIDITSLGDIDITTTGAAGEDINITNTGGSVNITATEPNAADAIVLKASNRGTIDVRGALNQNVTLCLFEDTPICANWGADGTETWGGIAVGTTHAENICIFPGASFIYHNIGTQSVLGPIADANGFDFSLDDTTAEGVEYCPKYKGPGRQVFTVGTDAFYLKVTMTLSDVSGFSDVAVGFRLQENFQDTIEAYDSYNCLSVASGTINHMREINGGSAVDVSTGDSWADNSTHTLEIRIAADKSVTYFIDGDTPTTPVTHSWTDTDKVCPFLFILNSTDVGGPVNVLRWECGLQY